MFSDPPYFVLVVGLGIAFLCGTAFEITLKRQIDRWAQSCSSRILIRLQGLQLILPYLGICVGTCLFLGSGLMVFSFPAAASYSVAALLTILTGSLIWVQLSTLLVQLQEGGSEALKIDAF